MDLGSILGIVSGIIFIGLSMLMGADWDMELVAMFWDPPSIMITIGGTIAATLLANPLTSIKKAFGAAKIVFSPPKNDPASVINQIIQLSTVAKREGLLQLEEAVRNMDDPFLLKGVMLIVDGADDSLVKSVLETEMSYIESRHADNRGVYDFIGGSAPSWGMVGTLIGLVLMLAQMQDPSTLGPKMAIAIITTFYGSVVANFLALPMSNKLKIYSGDELLIRELQTEGVLSILNGENPRNIEDKLKAFISPSIRSAAGVDKTESAGGKDVDGDD